MKGQELLSRRLLCGNVKRELLVSTPTLTEADRADRAAAALRQAAEAEQLEEAHAAQVADAETVAVHLEAVLGVEP